MTSEQKFQLFFDQALLFAGSSQYEAAIASYDQAIAIKPDNNVAWYSRGLALSDLGRNEEAIASYDLARAQTGLSQSLAQPGQCAR